MKKETEIIHSILAGDTADYQRLVERYQAGLIIHCDQLLHDRGTAEDAAQEAFIKAYENLRAFDSSKGNFSTWLYRIATNKCLDYLRKNRRFVPLLITEEPFEEPLSMAEINHIRKAVEDLQPPEYSLAVKAYFWECKSYSQIAAELQTTTGTIGTWISRAKVKLRKELA